MEKQKNETTKESMESKEVKEDKEVKEQIPHGYETNSECHCC